MGWVLLGYEPFFLRLGPLSFFTSGLWVDQYSYHAIPLLLPYYHLTCACCASFGRIMYFSLIQFMLSSVSARLILIPSWASSTHFIPLGIPSLLYSFEHPWLILFLHSYRLLLRLFRLPQPNYHILYFQGSLAFVLTPFANSFPFGLL